MAQVLHSASEVTKKMFGKKRLLLSTIHHLVLTLDLGCYVSQCSVVITNTQEKQLKGGMSSFTPKISANGHLFLPFLSCGETDDHDGGKWQTRAAHVTAAGRQRE